MYTTDPCDAWDMWALSKPAGGTEGQGGARSAQEFLPSAQLSGGALGVGSVGTAGVGFFAVAAAVLLALLGGIVGVGSQLGELARVRCERCRDA